MSLMKLKDGMDKWIVCRVCLDQPPTGLESIFHQNCEKDLSLLIHECGGVPVKQFDHYPDKICTKCLQCLNEAYIFRKTCQHSHKRLSQLIAPMDVGIGEQQRLGFAEEYTIEELELKFDPKKVNGEIKTEMVLDDDATEEFVPKEFNGEIKTEMVLDCDATEEFVPEREITKSARIEASKTTSSTAVDNEKQQITSHVEEDAVENLKKCLKLKVEIDETKMISEVFHIFDKGSEHASAKDSEMCDENKAVLDKAFSDEYGKLIGENKMEKAEYLDALKNETFSNSSGEEYVPQLKKSSLRKIKVNRKELKLKRSKIQMSATSDDEFLPNTEKTFDCDVCGLTFAQNQDLRTHKNKCKTRTKKRSNTCDICGKSFNIKMGLKRHKIEVHNMVDTDCNLQTYKCEICERTFIQKAHLTIHMRTHTGERPYRCSYCPQSFAVKATCDKHHRTHTNERPFTCDICNKSFVTKYVMKKHKMGAHEMIDNDSSHKKYKCEICERNFFQKICLTIHMRTHTGERPFKCSYCPKAFADHGSRNRHHRSHTNERPYTCDVCGKSFAIKLTLKKHKIGVHNLVDIDSINIKTYKCEICERTFIQKPHLICHMRRHNNERPCKCSFCPKSFADSGALRNHYRTHTKEQPYACDICGKSFAINIVSKHKMRVHGESFISEKLLVNIEPKS